MSAWVQVVDTQIKSICEPDWPERGGDTMRHNADQLTRFCVSALRPTSRSRRLGKTDAKMLESVGKRSPWAQAPSETLICTVTYSNMHRHSL